MNKKLNIAALMLFALFFSCSKNQKVVREIEGLWHVHSYTLNGGAIFSPGTTASLNFTRCKVKKGDCDGSLTIDTLTIPTKYSITENGTRYSISSVIPGLFPSQSGTITEHAKSTMVFTSVENGDTSVMTLVR